MREPWNRKFRKKIKEQWNLFIGNKSEKKNQGNIQPPPLILSKSIRKYPPISLPSVTFVDLGHQPSVAKMSLGWKVNVWPGMQLSALSWIPFWPPYYNLATISAVETGESILTPVETLQVHSAFSSVPSLPTLINQCCMNKELLGVDSSKSVWQF